MRAHGFCVQNQRHSDDWDQPCPWCEANELREEIRRLKAHLSAAEDFHAVRVIECQRQAAVVDAARELAAAAAILVGVDMGSVVPTWWRGFGAFGAYRDVGQAVEVMAPAYRSLMQALRALDGEEK